jgi:hypothetical protein
MFQLLKQDLVNVLELVHHIAIVATLKPSNTEPASPSISNRRSQVPRMYPSFLLAQNQL